MFFLVKIITIGRDGWVPVWRVWCKRKLRCETIIEAISTCLQWKSKLFRYANKKKNSVYADFKFKYFASLNTSFHTLN